MTEEWFLPNADEADMAVALREALLAAEAMRLGESGHIGTWMALVAVLRARTGGTVPLERQELAEVALSEEVSGIVDSLARRRYSAVPGVWKQVSLALRTVRRRRG